MSRRGVKRRREIIGGGDAEAGFTRWSDGEQLQIENVQWLIQHRRATAWFQVVDATNHNIESALLCQFCIRRCRNPMCSSITFDVKCITDHAAAIIGIMTATDPLFHFTGALSKMSTICATNREQYEVGILKDFFMAKNGLVKMRKVAKTSRKPGIGRQQLPSHLT